MMCAMCGKEDRLVVAKIEGTELKVCNSCARYGKVLRQVAPPKSPKQSAKEEKRIKQIIQPELIEMVVPDFSALIRKKRESMGLKQLEFAKKINEKESVIQNLEQGRMTPSLELARKLGRYLNIKLVEQYEEKSQNLTSTDDGELTLGDLIKIKKR